MLLEVLQMEQCREPRALYKTLQAQYKTLQVQYKTLQAQLELMKQPFLQMYQQKKEEKSEMKFLLQLKS